MSDLTGKTCCGIWVEESFLGAEGRGQRAECRDVVRSEKSECWKIPMEF